MPTSAIKTSDSDDRRKDPDQAAYLLAADTGGTFTDLTVFDKRTGETRFAKTLTTYDNLMHGVMSGLSDADVALDKVNVFKHGTTHVINAFIQRRGGKTALITTEGFRDVLEIARGNRPETFNLRYRRDACLVPRRFRFEIRERTGGDGSVVTPLDEASVTALIPLLKKQGIEAIAVALLNSYANPAHEERVAEILRTALPQVYVTASTWLTREWMEFERSSTAAANAYVGTRMSSYIKDFRKDLEQKDFGGKFYLTSSSGGVISAEDAIAMPIALVESGPAGGCIGAAAYARALGLEKVIAFDMGGTTAKCTLVEDGRFDVLGTYWVDGYQTGFPIRASVVDIVEVGAGGGSIAWLDQNGRMRLGPQSAGSTPGPVAFGNGGTSPTVTDANVVLGRIGPDSFMGGRLRLDVQAALSAIDEKLRAPLGYKGEHALDQVAQGILDMANVTMAGVIKEVSIERGRDVRSYSLFAFGGGGPLFATELAHDLGISEVIIPPHPGNFSSLGMLMASARHDVSRTFIRRLDQDSVAEIIAIYDRMEQELLAAMRAEFDVGGIHYIRTADMKYTGQAHSVRIRLGGELTVPQIQAAFEREYLSRYGHVNERMSLEFVTIRCSGVVPTPMPELDALSPAPGASGDLVAPHSRREVYFSGLRKKVMTPVYQRTDLPAGTSFSGPAIIEEFTSTTVIGPSDQITVGHLGELRIDCSGQDESKDDASE